MKNTYEVKGMHCPSCSAKIRDALQGLVAKLEVTFQPPRAILESDRMVSLALLNEAVAKAGDYTLTPIAAPLLTVAMQPNKPSRSGLATYYPLLLIIAMIAAVSLKSDTVHGWMLHFMAGFFLVFGAFKLLDIKGFQSAYATYDLLAKRWSIYGLIYPFLELFLGFSFLFSHPLTITLWLSVLLMSFSSLGVINALREKRLIPCACLGTTLNLPMSTITLVEDLGMVAMSIAMLWWA